MAGTPNPLITAYQANQNAQAPAIGTSIGVALPSAAPSIGPSLGAPIGGPAVSVAPPTQTQTDQGERNRLINTGSGVDQISNPLLRGIAKTADIVGSVFAPNLAQFIPGTTLHHQLLVNQATNNVEKDQASDEADTRQEDQQAQVTQRQALAEQEQAKAFALTHPKPETPEQQKPENLQQEHADAVIDSINRGVDPATDPKTQQLAYAITSLQKTTAPKEPNKDDKYIAINSKLAAGQPLSPDETAFKAGYEHYVKVNKLDPAGVRAQIMLQMPEAVADPNNPGHTIITTRKNSIGMQAANDMSVTQPKNTVKDFTDGKAGQNLNAINTAYHHLDNLDAASKALQNGDVQALNSIANSMGVAVQKNASPAIVYNLIKTALTGELGKSFTGAGATVDEQKNLSTSFNSSNSLATDQAVSAAARLLLNGKEQSLKEQYTQGLQGKPNFAIRGGGSVEEYTRDANGKLVKAAK